MRNDEYHDGQRFIHHSAFIISLLGCFRDFAALDASGTNPHPHRAALRSLRANLLQIRVKAALGAIIRVRDVVTELRPLATDFASFRHDC